jgi:hypothetical protein
VIFVLQNAGNPESGKRGETKRKGVNQRHLRKSLSDILSSDSYGLTTHVNLFMGIICFHAKKFTWRDTFM